MNDFYPLGCNLSINNTKPVRPILKDPNYLLKYNFLSEFSTALEKKFARENLGITWETFGNDLINSEGFLETLKELIEKIISELTSISWGNIEGDIKNQEDLIEYIANQAFNIITVDSENDLDTSYKEGTIAYVKDLKYLLFFNGTTWELLKGEGGNVDLGDLPDRISELETIIANLPDRISELENRITDLENTQGDEGSSIVVDSELSETSINPVLNKVVTKAINDVNSSIEEINELITGIEENITNIEEGITNINESITNIEENVTNIDNRINNLDERVTTIEGDVTNINEFIENINESITNINETIDNITIDNELSKTSTNAVQNKVVTKEIDKIKVALEDAGIDIDNPGETPDKECRYSPNDAIPDDTISTHGNINMSKEALDGLTFSELMDIILFPTINPTIVAPYIDFSKFGIPTKVEANSVLIPTAEYIQEHTSLNKGSMTAGSYKLDRSGEGTYLTSTIYGVTAGDVYIRTSISVICTYDYEEGPTPLNSIGVEATKDIQGKNISALPAGSITEKYLIVAYMPIFANNLNNSEFNKIKVWEFNNPNEFELSFVSENPEHHTIKIPSNKNCTVQYWDTVINGGSWQSITFDFLDYDVIDVGDKAVDYKILNRHYEAGRLDFVGATKYKFKIS